MRRHRPSSAVASCRVRTTPEPAAAHARAAAVLLTLGLAACGGDDTPDRLAAAVDTVDGVERFTYPETSAGDLGWSLDTVAVLGDAFAEDAYQFDRVSGGGLASDDQGNLYLLDRQGSRVLKYNTRGEHLATYGREGEGPGELSQPMALAVGPGDTVWISDFSNRRFTGFPQNGGDPRSIPLGDGIIPGQELAAQDGGFITVMNPLVGISVRGDRASVVGGDDSDGGAEPVRPVLRLDGSLATLDTLWSAPEPPRDMVQLEAGGNIMVAMMSRTFHPDFQWAAFSDGGIVVSDTAAYLLHVLDGDGARAHDIERAPAPRPVTEADREVARQRVRDESQGGGIRVGSGGNESAQEELLRQRLEKMTFAEVLPRVIEIAVDPADRIWVGVSEDTPDRVDRIDIYRRDGALLGELRGFPFPDVFLGTGRIGVLRRDELDVQQVVILDVNRMEQEVATR